LAKVAAICQSRTQNTMDPAVKSAFFNLACIVEIIRR
jgi:hypothetical protein